MNQDRITKMLEHEPYSCIMKNYELADILFENEGLMTVPKKSANTIVDLLNIAYKNGVKSSKFNTKLLLIYYNFVIRIVSNVYFALSLSPSDLLFTYFCLFFVTLF